MQTVEQSSGLRKCQSSFRCMRAILLVCVVLALLTLGAGSLRYMLSTSASLLTHIGYMYSAEGTNVSTFSSDKATSPASQGPTSDPAQTFSLAFRTGVDVEHPQAKLNSSSPSGYIIAMHYWEQLTMSAQNLLDLQCWAAMHNMVVVKPFIVGPYARFSFKKVLPQSWLPWEALYNVTDWRRHSAESGLSPLIDREDFYRIAGPKKMQVILIKLPWKGCTFQWPEDSGKEVLFAFKNWKIHTRAGCISYDHGSLQSFAKTIFGQHYPPHNVIVVFNLWPGFSPVSVPGAHLACREGRKYICLKPPSAELERDARLYADKYLGGFGQYLAIAARFEKLVAAYVQLKGEKYRQVLTKEIKETTSIWKALKRNTLLSSTFVSFDYGKYGSDTFKRKDYLGAQAIIEEFHQNIYNHSLSFAQWENSFEDVCHTNHSGYITALHLQIIARAKCIIIIGTWSNFQKVLNQEYLRHHPTDPCVFVVGGVGSKFC